MTPSALALARDPLPVAPHLPPRFGPAWSRSDPGSPRSDPGSPRLLRRGDLLAQGFTDNHIRRARREGALVTLAPGVYLADVDFQQLDERTGFHVAVAATIAGLSGDPVVSHRTAAIVHGLVDLAGDPPVDVIRAGPVKARYGPGLRVHRGQLDPDEVARVRGLRVTTAPRTVLDCVLALPPGPAAALLHGAVTGGHVTPAELDGQLRRHRRTPGVRTAGALLRAVTGEHRVREFDHSATVISTCDGLPVGPPEAHS